MAKEAMVPAASAIQPKMNAGSLSVFSDAECAGKVYGCSESISGQ